MRLVMAKTSAVLAVVLAWLRPDAAYARCYAGGEEGGVALKVGADEIALIVATVALAVAAIVLIFLRTRRRRRAQQEENEPESDEESP